MTSSATPDALIASITADRPILATFDFADKTFDVIRKPSTLLIAELARTGSGDPEAIGVLAEFFEVTLGKDGYRIFKKAFNEADLDEDQDVLMGILSDVLEQTLGRPTRSSKN